jgi:CDP-diacylglycerol--serine O-phosphatidyltransferase
MKIRPVKGWQNKIRFGNRQKLEPHLRKKRRLKYIAILPSFITLLNGACGFIAIVFASRGPELEWSFLGDLNLTAFVFAGYMIILAMVADVLDGRIARLTRTTSSFGGQLDSLCDTVSFGVAPAFLMMNIVEFHLENLEFENLIFSAYIGRGIFFSAIFYAMCAIVRLARFNVENVEDETAHMNFVGLPSPAAAGVVVSLLIFYQQFLAGIDSMQYFAVIGLPLTALLAGVLMVSRIKYPHLPNQMVKSKKPLPTLLAIFACGIFMVWNIQLVLFIGFCGYAAFGIVRWIIVGISKKATHVQANNQ